MSASSNAAFDRSRLDRNTLEEIVEIAGDPARLAAFDAAGESCSWCAEPVRLSGGVTAVDVGTGEVVQLAGGPGRVYFKACGSRRATRCPACAERYRMDARMIVLAGLRGGKGVPEEIAGHPAVFATLTAPSFGAVHRARTRDGRRLTCRDGGAARCPHGRSRRCATAHRENDACVGEPLCVDCYDYERQVLFNALAPELWRRTTIYARRVLARGAGLRERELRGVARLSFVKVAEYQRRGVVHLHVVARLDPVDEGELPPGLDTGALVAALATAARQVRVSYPGGFAGEARFGDQLVIDVLERGDDDRAARSVAGYLGKYATKGSDENGALDRRVRSRHDPALGRLSAHLRRLVETAWRLHARPGLEGLGLRRFAHALGFRGHWMTKSRRWSTTFANLRLERAAWVAAKREESGGELTELGDARRAALVEVRAQWRYEGRGWETGGEAHLAARRDEERRETMRSVRELATTTLGRAA